MAPPSVWCSRTSNGVIDAERSADIARPEHFDRFSQKRSILSGSNELAPAASRGADQTDLRVLAGSLAVRTDRAHGSASAAVSACRRVVIARRALRAERTRQQRWCRCPDSWAGTPINKASLRSAASSHEGSGRRMRNNPPADTDARRDSSPPGRCSGMPACQRQVLYLRHRYADGIQVVYTNGCNYRERRRRSRGASQPPNEEFRRSRAGCSNVGGIKAERSQHQAAMKKVLITHLQTKFAFCNRTYRASWHILDVTSKRR